MINIMVKSHKVSVLIKFSIKYIRPYIFYKIVIFYTLEPNHFKQKIRLSYFQCNICTKKNFFSYGSYIPVNVRFTGFDLMA